VSTKAIELFVVSSCHEGTDWCVRKATLQEALDEARDRQGWAMPYDDATDLAARQARELGCRWYDFSGDPAPEDGHAS
jgi:hypothetical protein